MFVYFKIKNISNEKRRGVYLIIRDKSGTKVNKFVELAHTVYEKNNWRRE